MRAKVVFLTKRRPMNRDLLHDPYGRFYYLPRGLAERGYDVTVVLFSYRSGENVSERVHGIQWHSLSPVPGVTGFSRRLRCILDDAKPDWIIGCSDTYFGIAAEHLARRFNCRSAIDAYDNYCAYIPWAKPLHYLWRRAVSRADLATVAGPSLAELWRPLRTARGSVVVPMAPDPDGFHLIDRFRARHDLGLPGDKPLVGYTGSIHPQRGIDRLFRAFEQARLQRPDLTLVLSGRLAPEVTLPPNCIYLGFLPQRDVPKLINSLDVMAVINKDSSFGNYSYPVKLYEAMACQVPVVASRTASTRWILRDFPDLLTDPGDIGQLRDRLLHALRYGRVHYTGVTTWDDSAEILHTALDAWT